MKLSKNVKKNLFNILFVLLLFGITFGILIVSSEELNWTTVKAFFADCNGWILLCAFVCMLLFVFFEGLSLHIICRRLGYRPKIQSSIAYSASDVYYSALTPSATGGQPASAFYMVRDGIDGGTAGFGLLLNLFAYTGAILVIGVFAFLFGWSELMQLGTVTQIFIFVGLAMQILLFAFFFLCMAKDKMVLHFGNGIVRLLCKFHILKKKEKWLERWRLAVVKYHDGYEEFKKHKSLFVWALLLNVLQRASQVLISYFVCRSFVEVNLIDIFCAQAFVTLGYNSIPIPGGSGAFEFLYNQTYTVLLVGVESSKIVIALMITRLISYYICMVLCGIYTYAYHIIGGRKKLVSEKYGDNVEDPPEETDVKQRSEIAKEAHRLSRGEVTAETAFIVGDNATVVEESENVEIEESEGVDDGLPSVLE